MGSLVVFAAIFCAPHSVSGRFGARWLFFLTRPSRRSPVPSFFVEKDTMKFVAALCCVAGILASGKTEVYVLTAEERALWRKALLPVACRDGSPRRQGAD